VVELRAGNATSPRSPDDFNCTIDTRSSPTTLRDGKAHVDQMMNCHVPSVYLEIWFLGKDLVPAIQKPEVLVFI
jgi:hypothetical protein